MVERRQLRSRQTSDYLRQLEATGLSPDAARQKIYRGGPGVMKLAGLSFPKNVRFLYLGAQFATSAYWDALIRDIGQASPSHHHCGFDARSPPN